MKLLELFAQSLFACYPLFGQTLISSPPPALVLRHVTVIDSTDSSIRQDIDVLIQGGRIASLSPSSKAEAPKKAVLIDATGKFLIAGLWDMHVHALSKGLPDRFFPLFIANGVLGIRDMGGDIPLTQVAVLKKEIANGSRLGPEIFAAGPILEGEHPFWPFSIAVKNPAEGRLAVQKLAKEGADFIKVYNTLSRDSYLAIASQAKESGIPFVGHLPDSVNPEEASALGQKSIEHLWGIPTFVNSHPELLQTMQAQANDTDDQKLASDLFYKVNEAILANFDSQKAHKLFTEFGANRTWQTPTLSVLRAYTFVRDPALRSDNRLAYIPDDLLKFWNSMGGAPDARNDQMQNRLFQQDVEIVRMMHTDHVPLLAGTDTPNPFVYPGFSLHDELALFVVAGFSPGESLKAATIRSAEFLGVEKDFGTVEVGKVANLVLLDANPLEDIHNTTRIHAVILRGNYLSRGQLDELLAKQRLPFTRK